MKAVVIGVVALVLIGGGFLAVQSSQKKEKMEQKAMMEKEVMEMEKKTMEEKAMMEQEAMKKEAMMNVEGDMKKDDSMMKEEGVVREKNTETMMEKDESAMMTKGSYEVYSASKLTMAEKGDVVLFFKASWCPTCKALDGDIKANAGSIPAGVTILEVNYDTETALKQKYGVTYQHTLVQVDSNGTQIAKWSGSPTLAALVKEVK
jgi:thiol-disulfide isomerase/thioredoxin